VKRAQERKEAGEDESEVDAEVEAARTKQRQVSLSPSSFIPTRFFSTPISPVCYFASVSHPLPVSHPLCFQPRTPPLLFSLFLTPFLSLSFVLYLSFQGAEEVNIKKGRLGKEDLAWRSLVMKIADASQDTSGARRARYHCLLCDKELFDTGVEYHINNSKMHKTWLHEILQ